MTDARAFVAPRLKAALKDRGMTPHALAKAIRVAPYAVVAWTKGERAPSAESIRRTCRALGIRADWLLGLEEPDGKQR